MDNNLIQKIYAGERISQTEAVALFSMDLVELGRAADFRRRLTAPEETVGFILDRIINYTNICEAACEFCAYHAEAGAMEGYELTIDEIVTRAGELAAIGGSQVMLQGGLHPSYTVDHYCTMLRAIKERFPQLYLHSFSPAEIVHIAKKQGLSIDAVIARLKGAGLDSMPGASDLLVDRVRASVCPHKLRRDEWIAVMKSLHAAGMQSSATMTYGMGETLEERIMHLDTVRTVQDQTGIIRAFIPWSFSPARTRLCSIIPATGMDYLRMVAISRIYLDNIVYIQAGWLTEGLKLAQIALSMGANDMGGILMEEVVVRATGIETVSSIEEFVCAIVRAGKIPVQRDSRYVPIRRYELREP